MLLSLGSITLLKEKEGDERVTGRKAGGLQMVDRLQESHFFSLLSGRMKQTTSARFLASLIAQLEKNPPAMQETLGQFLGQEDTLEKR